MSKERKVNEQARTSWEKRAEQNMIHVQEKACTINTPLLSQNTVDTGPYICFQQHMKFITFRHNSRHVLYMFAASPWQQEWVAA